MPTPVPRADLCLNFDQFLLAAPGANHAKRRNRQCRKKSAGAARRNKPCRKKVGLLPALVVPAYSEAKKTNKEHKQRIDPAPSYVGVIRQRLTIASSDSVLIS